MSVEPGTEEHPIRDRPAVTSHSTPHNKPDTQYPAPKYTSQLRKAEENLGRTFFVPGERNMPKEIELATDALSLSATFTKEDQANRDALACLGETISHQLPMTNLERVDLATGDPIDHMERPLDPVIVNWCASGADRWVAVIRENRMARGSVCGLQNHK